MKWLLVFIWFQQPSVEVTTLTFADDSMHCALIAQEYVDDIYEFGGTIVSFECKEAE